MRFSITIFTTSQNISHGSNVTSVGSSQNVPEIIRPDITIDYADTPENYFDKRKAFTDSFRDNRLSFKVMLNDFTYNSKGYDNLEGLAKQCENIEKLTPDLVKYIMVSIDVSKIWSLIDLTNHPNKAGLNVVGV